MCRFAICWITTSRMRLRKSAISGVFERWNSWQKMYFQISWLRLITVYYEYGKCEKFGDLHSVTIIRQKIVKIYNLIISTSGIWLRKSAISRVFERWNSWQKICLKISWLRLITVYYEYGRYEKIRWSSKLDNIKITNWCRVTTLSGFVLSKSAITQPF